MPTPNKYAIRITEDNLALVRILCPMWNIEVKEDTNRFFLFTVDSRNSTTDHDVVQGDDLEGYDGDEPGRRIILQ